MTLTEKMRKNLNIHKSLRAYFDAGSDEFNKVTYDEKIKTLSKIISGGYDLGKIIKDYKKPYNIEGKASYL